jgi:hypothetical protein
MPDYRLVVCFDLTADNLKKAYEQLEQRLNKVELAWETSDEWYDETGEQGDPDRLTGAITSYFMERQHDQRPCKECGHLAKEHEGNGKCTIARSDTSTQYKSVRCPCPGLLTVVEDARTKTDTGA